ncbi:hypothetical protein OIU74_028825 [Salix koriyanagi]|uniref:Protein kinase domain-containing protein n=1 Tax=Salix koriyanagi TaxID=2511006 RepID=A0A9Q0VEP1_9ROSI|nr:hypothetical protein OIU74_028825 [Salix koriyanagi]
MKIRIDWGDDLIGRYPYDYGVDIWALGCTVAEMLSGDSQDLHQIPSSISDDAKDLMGRCLARNAAQRWSADELLEHPFLSVG